MGVSQEELAQAAALPRKTVYNAEKHGRVGRRTVDRLAAAFGVPISALYESREIVAEALFLATRVSRLPPDAKHEFFRALESAAPMSDIEREALVRAPNWKWKSYINESDAVRKLLDEGDRLREDRPREALEYLRLAVSIAEEVAHTHPGFDARLRASAWKDLAWTLRGLGEYAEAEAAIDRAEAVASTCGDARLQARVKLSRAIVLTTAERLDEALAIVRETRPLFIAADDREGHEMAVEQEALILVKLGDTSAAITIMEALPIDGVDDRTKARRFGNLAWALQNRGEYAAARQYLEKASALHANVGALHAVAKDKWLLGVLMAKTGDVDGGLETLARVSDSLRQMEDADTAVRIDLDRCAIEIENGVQTASTFDRLRAVASYAIDKRLPQSTCRALLFLQQLGRQAKPAHIRFVKDFIADLPKHPHREFVPPEIAA